MNNRLDPKNFPKKVMLFIDSRNKLSLICPVISFCLLFYYYLVSSLLLLLSSSSSFSFSSSSSSSSSSTYSSSTGITVLGEPYPLPKLFSTVHPFPILEASQLTYFLWGGVISLTPKSQPGEPGVPFCLRHPAWETVTVAALPPA